jgi:glutamate/tyrosine decarboxylase-like PLP-dependent enzyme
VSPETPDPGSHLGAFDWHPEPELIDVRDPAVSRAALERLGHDAWGAALDYLYDEALRRAMGEPTTAVPLRALFFGEHGGPAPAPDGPTPSADLLAEFRDRVAPHQLNAWHPRTLSYFTPPPLLLSIVGELLAQFTQQGVDVWHAGPSAAFVEEEVVRWLCDLVGYGDGSFGLLASGGVMANFMALALARDVQLRRLRGLDRPPRGAALEDARIYVSDQGHFSVARALDELGFPAPTLVTLPSDDRFRLRTSSLADAVTADLAARRVPFAVVAVSGTTNTGSIDDVPAIAEVCRRHGLWLHVDAAYGGAARLSADLAGLVPGLELADSVTVDPHKWFFQAYDIGGLMVRDGSLLEQTFSRRPEYYRGGGDTAREHDSHDNDSLDFYRMGFEGTRRWRALKLWMSWKHLGTRGLGRLVAANVAIAKYLSASIAAADDFEQLPATSELSVVCFRHVPRRAKLAPDALDAHQDALQASLEASGDAWLSTTRLRGSTWLRAGIMNPMTTESDIDRLLAELRRLAA